MNMQYLDLLYIFRQTNDGFDFIYALTESDDLEIYGISSVQIIIDRHHAYWWKFNIFGIGLPMLI